MGWLRRRRNRRVLEEVLKRALNQARRLLDDREALVLEVDLGDGYGVVHGLRAREGEWRRGIQR